MGVTTVDGAHSTAESTPSAATCAARPTPRQKPGLYIGTESPGAELGQPMLSTLADYGGSMGAEMEDTDTGVAEEGVRTAFESRSKTFLGEASGELGSFGRNSAADEMVETGPDLEPKRSSTTRNFSKQESSMSNLRRDLVANTEADEATAETAKFGLAEYNGGHVSGRCEEEVDVSRSEQQPESARAMNPLRSADVMPAENSGAAAEELQGQEALVAPPPLTGKHCARVICALAAVQSAQTLFVLALPIAVLIGTSLLLALPVLVILLIPLVILVFRTLNRRKEAVSGAPSLQSPRAGGSISTKSALLQGGTFADAVVPASQQQGPTLKPLLLPDPRLVAGGTALADKTAVVESSFDTQRVVRTSSALSYQTCSAVPICEEDSAASTSLVTRAEKQLPKARSFEMEKWSVKGVNSKEGWALWKKISVYVNSEDPLHTIGAALCCIFIPMCLLCAVPMLAMVPLLLMLLVPLACLAPLIILITLPGMFCVAVATLIPAALFLWANQLLTPRSLREHTRFFR